MIYRNLVVAAVLVAIVSCGVVPSDLTSRQLPSQAGEEEDATYVSWLQSAAMTSPGSSPNLRAALSQEPGQPVGYFFRSLPDSASGHALPSVPLSDEVAGILRGVSHLRLLPGLFPKGMTYHFDGLASVLKFSFQEDGSVQWLHRNYASDAFTNYDKCIFYGTGTGPTLGTHICFTNPAVNLLPIAGQLWLTIDTANWGRVDLDTLDTVAAKVLSPSLVLNAHPACDPTDGSCFVQYPCAANKSPFTREVCVGSLHPGPTDMKVKTLSESRLDTPRIIQHSHSPCITPGYVVTKLDFFKPRSPLNTHGGVLKVMQQGEGTEWLVFNRHTNSSWIATSDVAFVNNHFWNCYEDEGHIVVESITATEDYLDNYFIKNLRMAHPDWQRLFHRPARCRVPMDPSANDIRCEDLLEDGHMVFDYPTFNPLFKMNKDYRFVYGIAPGSPESRWFDTIVKIDVRSRRIANTWWREGVYLTEADYVPRPGSDREDDGLLLTVLYDENKDSSSLAVFEAAGLNLLSTEVAQMLHKPVTTVQGRLYSELIRPIFLIKTRWDQIFLRHFVLDRILRG